jgi:prepilin-type N-terminal cleavage/methylation domain-containing protein
MRRVAGGLRAGFTLIEVLVTVSLLSLVGANVYMVLADSSRAYEAQTITADTELQVRRTLDRIALAIMGSSADTLWTVEEAPHSAHALNFESNLGMQDGEPVWSEPQQIALINEGTRNVAWFENPDMANQRKVVWNKYVAEFAAGETPNGLDDNGNGLIDELGLSFDKQGNSVIIRLTIQRQGPGGKWVTRELFTTVTCRN